MNIAVIGAGKVGGALAVRLARAGHRIVLGAPDPASDTIRALQNEQPGLVAKSTADAVAAVELVFIAVPFSAVQTVLTEGGDFSGKIIVDCTNPVGPGIANGSGASLGHRLGLRAGRRRTAFLEPPSGAHDIAVDQDGTRPRARRRLRLGATHPMT